MKLPVSIISILLCFFMTAPEIHAQEELEKQAIIQRLNTLTDALKAKDLTAIASIWTDDAAAKLPGRPMIKGKHATLEAFKPMLAQGMTIDTKTEEVFVHGEYATEIGSYKILVPDGAVIDAGTYATLWQKINDTWFISRDIISSNGPAVQEGK